jgi:hypothetical protein
MLPDCEVVTGEDGLYGADATLGDGEGGMYGLDVK